MDKIEFDIESSFALYVNESIEQFFIAIEKKESKHYKFSLIFAGTAIELGLALIVKQGMKKNIYTKNKDLHRYGKIKELFENGLKELTKELFKGYAYIAYDPTVAHPVKNISIKTEILEKEILKIRTARNNLLHNNGAILIEDIEKDLFGSLLFLNLILPEGSKFHKILDEKFARAYLEKSSNETTLAKISNAFEIFQDCEYEHCISTIENSKYYCIDCGNASMINIDCHADFMPGYLCLLCVSHGFLNDCCLCGKLIQHGDEIEWNEENHAYVCEDCNNRY